MHFAPPAGAGWGIGAPLWPCWGRERETLELIAQGCGNAAIARKLGLSTKTIRNHVSNVFNKLQVTDRAHAIIKAREAGLGR